MHGDDMSADRPIVVAGAGSVGCFVGGVLAAGGRDVALLARPRVITAIRSHGLRVTAEGLDCTIPASQLSLSDDPAILRKAGIVLVTVKSADTAAMADMIVHHAPDDAVVVSLQNGVGNVAKLRKRLPGRPVRGGMVSFNVLSMGNGRYHRATSGALVIEADSADTAARLSVACLAVRTTDDIVGVQWGKLLVNLNNALNALSGMPLRDQLTERRWRLLFADQMAEGLAVLRSEGIRPISATPIPAGLTPHLLRLPDFLFMRLLGRTIRIDPAARSSMWEDLQLGRRSEIDYLQGVIVQIALRHGVPVPISQRVVALVRSAEASGAGSPGLTPEQIRGCGLPSC
jgi:2-dehydropantoate 2-reductase